MPQATGTLDTVRVAVLEEWPPHYLVTEDGERPTGFAVAVMENVAARVGLVPVYVAFKTFPEAIEALRDGSVDVIPDFGISPSRGVDFSFTRPFATFTLSIMVRASAEDTDSVPDLAGRRVGVVRSNLAAEVLPAKYPDLVPVEFDNVQEGLFGLLAGGLDGIAYPDEVLLALARAAGVEDRLRILPEVLGEVPRAMAVRRADTLLSARLDQGLSDLLSSPEYARIYGDWLNPPRPFWTVSLVLYAAGGIIFLVLVVMGVWRYWTVSQLAHTLSVTLEDKERLESASQREQERFRALVETSYDGIVTTDVNDRIMFANRRMCEMLDTEENAILGHSVLEFVVPEHRDRVFEGTSRRRRGIADSYELAMQSASGDRVWVQIAVSPLPGVNADFQGSVAVVTDITARVRAEQDLREREERFRTFVEHATDLVSTLDAEGRMTYHSPPLRRLLGYTPEDLASQSAFDLIHPDDEPAMRATWEEVLRRPGVPITPALFRVRHADGSWRTWEVTLTNLLDNPAVAAILSNSTDVTSREELAHQLTQAQKMEAIGRLAGGVVHDFNNILTVIRSYADILTLDPTPTAAVEASQEIGRSVDRAHALTSQLLAFSRHRAARPEPLAPGQVLRGLENTLRRLMGERVEFRLSVEEPGWWFRSDSHQFEQILMNLAVNSKDALPAGGHFEVSVRNLRRSAPSVTQFGEMPPGEYVAIEVRDDGLGMNPQTVTHIFEPFFTTKGPGKGTGLGLAMVYGIVQRSGGYLDVETAEGQGTTFRMFFPRMEEPAPVAGAQAEAREEERSDTQRRRILLVEDEQSVRRAVRKILISQGHDVVEADSGAAALELVGGTAAGFDLLVTDVVMPGMTGPELAAELRVGHPELRAVFMSGYSENHVLALEAGSCFFIQKPFGLDELVELIRHALGD